MTNYNEKYTQITAQLAAALRAKSPTFTYEGAAYDITDRADRIRLIDRISSDYIAEHAAFNQRALDRWYDGGCRGERPKTVSTDFAMLERLADAVLNEELTDGDPYKSAHTEYPILSDLQMERRHDREVSLWVAEHLGTDGQDYRQKKRRMRSKWEHEYMDRGIRVRNAERKAQYRRDTSPGVLVIYNLRDTGGEFSPEFVQSEGLVRRWETELSQIYL